jgi:hypothetical protein
MMIIERRLEEARLQCRRNTMRGFTAAALLVAWIALAMGVTASGIAGEQRSALLKQYWGKITSVRVDRCGKRPGLCEGVIILGQRGAGLVSLAIRPGTWIKRGDHLVLLDELSVGDEIHVQAIEVAAEGGMRATQVDILKTQ